MSNKSNYLKPVAAAVGVAFLSSVVFSTTAVADDNPFSTADLDSGYMLAGDKGKGEEGKCGEGKCGGDKGEEGSCGGDKGEEGSCGGDRAPVAEASPEAVPVPSSSALVLAALPGPPSKALSLV